MPHVLNQKRVFSRCSCAYNLKVMLKLSALQMPLLTLFFLIQKEMHILLNMMCLPRTVSALNV